MLDLTDRAACVRVGGEVRSGAELEAAATAVAGRLGGMPAVAVHATATMSTVVAVVAGLLAGVPVVPVAADAGPLEAHHVLADSGAGALLADEVPGWAAEAGVEVLAVHDLARCAGTSTPTPPGDPDGRTALVLYTSGTTGLPKGVPVTRAAVAACIDALAARWGWGPHDTTAHGLPLWHVHGLVLGVLGPLRLGGRVHHTVRPTPGGHAAAAAAGARVHFSVPTVWGRVAADRQAARALAGARLLVSGSAALPDPVAAALAAEAGQAPVERYGMTETLITLAAPVAGPRRVGWVGPVLGGTEARVLGDDGAPVPADGTTIGDLEVRGPTVMAGYLHRPGASAEVLAGDGWLRTGDVACVDAGGWHRIVGRRSTDLIKSGGHRIGAGEVEAALLGHPSVREAAVVGEPDDDLGQAVVAYVVAEGTTAADLAAHVAARLSAHKRPRRVHLVDALPRNAMGKVQKGQLGPR